MACDRSTRFEGVTDLLLKLVAGFLTGGALLAGKWQPVALAAAIVLTVSLWRRVKALLNGR